MSQRLLDRIRDTILCGEYDLTRHAVEEMAEDNLIIFDVESAILDGEIVHTETGLDREGSIRLAEMGAKIRELAGFGLEEGVSSRLLVYVGRLMQEGLSPVEACTHAIAQTLTDDVEVRQSMEHIAQLYFGELMETPDAEPTPAKTRG